MQFRSDSDRLDLRPPPTGTPGPPTIRPHRGAQPQRRTHGFTLVELLVVIGIIALLISVLMPALTKARAQAKTVQCLSNIRQAGLALAMYTTENKGTVPAQWNGNIPVTDPDSWVYKLHPYTQSYEAFTCSNADDRRSSPSLPGVSFIYNGYASGAWGPRPSARVTRANDSAANVVMMDHAPLWENSWVIYHAEGVDPAIGAYWYWWYPHHKYDYVRTPGDYRSILYADGHAELAPRGSIKVEQLRWPLD